MPSNPNYSEYTAYYPGGSAPLTQHWDLYPGGSAPPGVEDRHTVQAGKQALNVAALLGATDTAPEANPRNTGGEVLSNIYRELRRLRGDVSYLKQK